MSKQPRKRRRGKKYWSTYFGLVERDGEQCRDCRKSPAELRVGRLEIDHIDEDSRNWDDGNLALRCKSCNVRKSDRLQVRKAESDQQVSSGCGGNGGRTLTTQRDIVSARRAEIDLDSSSPEMQANALYEDAFRDWLERLVLKRGSITWSDAVYGGAEFAGCSPKTSSEYAKKMTSISGTLKAAKDEAGRKIIVLREADQLSENEQR